MTNWKYYDKLFSCAVNALKQSVFGCTINLQIYLERFYDFGYSED